MAAAAAMNLVPAVGRLALSSLQQVGAVALFALRGLWAVAAGPWYPSQVGRQLVAIGFFSLPVIGLTAVFTGAALALNIYTGGGRFNAEQIMPQIVALGITRELGPVLAALMLAGRVAATMAAEIGAMRATEQIDAMKTLSTDPYGYLVAPRLVAAVIALPLLTVVADIIGIAGGWGVAVGFLDFNPTVYIRSTVDFVEPQDVGTGLLKAMAFGFIVALMGCHHGYSASGGARGVGRATTQAVVSAAILIFATDYVLTTLFTAR